MEDGFEIKMVKKVGRPSKLDDAIVDRLVAAIEQGASYAAACKGAGLARSTFDSWRRKGELATGGKYRIFLGRLRAAERVALEVLTDALLKVAVGGYEQTEVKRIVRGGVVVEEHVTTKVAAPNGPLLLQILERRDPATWAPRRQSLLEITDEPLQVRLYGAVGFGTDGDIVED